MPADLLYAVAALHARGHVRCHHAYGRRWHVDAVIVLVGNDLLLTLVTVRRCALA